MLTFFFFPLTFAFDFWVFLGTGMCRELLTRMRAIVLGWFELVLKGCEEGCKAKKCGFGKPAQHGTATTNHQKKEQPSNRERPTPCTPWSIVHYAPTLHVCIATIAGRVTRQRTDVVREQR